MAMVGKISKRLLPKIRKAEMERLKKARSGPQKESIDARFESMISESTQAPIQRIWEEEEDEGTNSKLVTMLRQAFRDPVERMLVIRALKGGSKSLQNPKLRPFILKLLNRLLDATQDDPSMFAKMRDKLRRMSQADEKETNESFKAFTSLKKKSDMTGIPLDVILEVFEREEDPDLGFNRVNSFINGGKAWELDADLAEKVKEPTGKLKDACWAGYTAVGTKKKNGKTVPNCVPKEEVETNEAKSPLQRLKDFDKTRAAVGKKPIFKDNEKKKPEVKEQQAEKAAKARIAREKEANKAKYDRMLDMARTRDTQTKNRQSMRKESIDKTFESFLEDEHENCGTPDCCGQCPTANTVSESLTEGFTAGISDTMFATEFAQNQVQGSFAYHPSVMEEGGAGELGTDKLKKKYKEDTPCEEVEEVEIYDGDDFFEAYGEMWYNEDEELDEAEYQGRKVTLGKPTSGDVKKFKVYVKSPSTGNIKKVEFGDPNMTIKKHIPARRKSFRARHNCDNPGPRDKARYWSCKKW
jgi:hypothetical protein